MFLFIFNFYRMKKTGLMIGVVVTAMAMSVLAGCTGAGQPQKPAEEVIKEGLGKLATVESASYDISVKGDIKDPSTTDVNLDLSAKGVFDVKDMKAPKLTLKLNLDASEKSGMTGKAGMDLRMNKDMFYFNVMNLDIKDMPFPDDVKGLMNKWWFAQIPAEMMEEMGVSSTTDGAATPEMQAKMKKILEGSTVFSKPAFVGTEDVGGEPSWHYTVTVDNKGLVALMKKAAEEQGETISESEVADMEDKFKNLTIAGDVWVGSVSGVLNKFAGSIKMAGAEGELQGNVTISAMLGGINKGATVDVPQAVEFTMDKAAPIMMMMQGGAAVPSDVDAYEGDMTFDAVSEI